LSAWRFLQIGPWRVIAVTGCGEFLQHGNRQGTVEPPSEENGFAYGVPVGKVAAVEGHVKRVLKWHRHSCLRGFSLVGRHDGDDHKGTVCDWRVSGWAGGRGWQHSQEWLCHQNRRNQIGAESIKMAIVLNSTFATAEDTAKELGVSKTRLKRLLRLVASGRIER